MTAPTSLPEVYSHSRLSSFESCPKKFEYRYLQRIVPETESIEEFLHVVERDDDGCFFG